MEDIMKSEVVSYLERITRDVQELNKKENKGGFVLYKKEG